MKQKVYYDPWYCGEIFLITWTRDGQVLEGEGYTLYGKDITLSEEAVELGSL